MSKAIALVMLALAGAGVCIGFAIPGDYGNGFGVPLAPGQPDVSGEPNGHPVSDAPNDAPGHVDDGNYGQSNAPGRQ